MLELALNYVTVSIAAALLVTLIVLFFIKCKQLSKVQKTIICCVCAMIAIYFVFVAILVFAFGNTHPSGGPKPVENLASLEHAEQPALPLTDTPVPGGDDRSHTEAPKASYHFTRYGKDGEAISIAALTDEKLAERIIMDVMAKSAAWQGVDVETLTEYYLIEQTFGTGEKSEYYAYLLDGKAVLQRGNKGLYSYLSQELYDELDGIYTDAVEITEP